MMKHAIVKCLADAGCIVHAMTPAEYVQAQPKPVFRAGHTLPRLFKRKALGVILVVFLQVITIYLIFGFQGFTA